MLYSKLMVSVDKCKVPEKKRCLRVVGEAGRGLLDAMMARLDGNTYT
jgi:hypothetical protein